MKLSVIIPVYRVETTLDRCVKSIVGQTFADMEIILVDDGSPDRCPQLCDEWARRDSRIRVIHQENGGLSEARNTGILQAQGEYITFADSDDWIGMETYRPLMGFLQEHPEVDLLEYPVYWHYGAEDQRVVNFGDHLFTDPYAYWLQTYAYEHTYAWNKLYRRSLFDEVRFPEGRVFEDVATLPRLLRHAGCVATCSEGLYHYCLNSEGITCKAGGKELEQLLEGQLASIEDPRLLDDRYYLRILNVQMDVCELTGKEPVLHHRRVNPFGRELSLKMRLKAVVLYIIGLKQLCKLNIRLHQLCRHHSSASC